MAGMEMMLPSVINRVNRNAIDTLTIARMTRYHGTVAWLEVIMDRSREAVAQRLAEAHYAIEPGIALIIQLLASPDREADPEEPVKLLEVNQNTTANGIRPVFFGPHAASGIFSPSVIVEVTPEEFEQIQRNPNSLPNGWRLGQEFAKAAPAGQR
jgi:hypothetical protein